MQNTTNYNLRLPEPTDPVDITAINTNMTIVDSALKWISSRSLKIACGTYTGNDEAERYINIGFRPVAVLMTNLVEPRGAEVTQQHTPNNAFATYYGWVAWVGDDIPAKYVKKIGGSTSYSDTILRFTPDDLGLRWKLDNDGAYPAAAVNNLNGKVYQWIAFG